ncbi:MAG: hypothetical protein M0R06_18405 [Sphaerochaeta sp.]|nr:hypothetical protein [Sphaerochaeta sp.]
MPKDKAPSGGWEQHILGLVRYIEGNEGFTKRNEKLKEQRDRRFRRHAPQIPEEYKKTAAEFRSPFIFDILRRAPGLTSAEHPTPKVIPISAGSDAQENSSKKEKWLKHAYRRMDKGGQTYNKIIDAMVADGMAVWRVIVDKHTWAVGRRKKDESSDDYLTRVKEHHKANFPFVWEQVPGDTVYPFYDEKGLEKVLVITTDSGARLAKKFHLGYNADGEWVFGGEGDNPPPETARFIEYWDRDTFGYMIDNTLVKVGDHDYGQVPFFFASLGDTSAPNVEDQNFGLGWPLMPLQDYEDSMMTMLANSAYWTAFPTPTLEPVGDNQVAPDEDEQNVTVEHIVGKLQVPPMGFKYGWMVPPALGIDAMRLLEWVKGQMDRIGLAPVLFGEVGKDVASATQQTAIAVAKSIMAPGLKNVSLGFNDMAHMMLRMVEKLGKDGVPIWVTGGPKGEWLVLTPKDVKGYYEVEHTAEPIIPAEQHMKYMYLADANQKGLIDKNKVREDGMNITDPEDMELKVMLENARQSPAYQQKLQEEWLRQHEENAGAGAAVPAVGAAMPPPANTPMTPGGPNSMGAPGLNMGMQPGGPVAARAQGQGRG